MTNKQLKNLLREKANATPIKDVKREVLSSVHHVPAPVEIKPKKEKPARPFFRLPVLAPMVASLLCCIALPLIALFQHDTPSLHPLSQKEIIFQNEAFALGNLLPSSGGGEQAVLLSGSSSPLFSIQREVPLKDAEKESYEKLAKHINRYLLTGEAFFSIGNLKSSWAKHNDADYEGYPYKLKIDYTDQYQTSTLYTLYYKETQNGGKTDLSGLYLYGQAEYPFTGGYQTKNSSSEQEVEMWLKVDLGKGEYLLVSNEREKEASEVEYEFSFEECRNGHLVKSSIEISIEDGRKQMVIELEENGQSQEFEFEYKKYTIECEYEWQGREIELTIYIHEDYYLYDFSKGNTVRIDK